MALEAAEADILGQFLQDFPPAFISLFISGTLLYFCLYAFARGRKIVFVGLSVPTLLLFWASTYVTVRCAAFRALLNFAVAVATMKLLDLHILSLTNSIPQYTSGLPLRPSHHALILLTELRYESFTPNPIRHAPPPKLPFPNSLQNRQHFYSEHVQLLLHLAGFIILQSGPQYPPIKALGILFTIYIIWTSIQLLVRYRTSPPLFGPIYLAHSLATFWTETWHNAFASPCLSLAYKPTLSLLTALRFPRSFSRAAAVVASFSLMAAFHVYALAPLLSDEGRKRVALFFVGNGVLTVLEVAVWGKRRHWVRAVVAWVVELVLASWVVQAVEVADGVLEADWRGLCKGRTGG
ncbi:uncharacterized protein BDR25DRAFT_290844 [Lindgomyces ingoldianus]|uniref:Uncharacterized protein n=1 Tax=Lindgomyces ingoldianus TaxID=673940 RepID=A0ACB6QMG4_9PLEO|nr:uncharacterized protein BDR25DRAFT_290844 [Lindgomyces ingoldianus]KAF2468178.1 hypothetical protein BDR25DRAFT_290844 [Lindgomyces ingoldianus]